jgi:hypothetical protein
MVQLAEAVSVRRGGGKPIITKLSHPLQNSWASGGLLWGTISNIDSMSDISNSKPTTVS